MPYFSINIYVKGFSTINLKALHIYKLLSY